jgi:HlyD family secretion protein
LFLIAQDLTKMQVDTNVSEADVGRVRVNQPATFTVDAYPGRTFTGTVSSIREAPINVQNVITYDAVISVSNSDLKLFPGMTANVKILVSRRPGVLRVTNAALRYHPASAPADTAASQTSAHATPDKAVWTLDADDNVQHVVIRTGESDGTFTEVTGGALKENDRVIVAALAKSAPVSGGGPGVPGRGPGF